MQFRLLEAIPPCDHAYFEALLRESLNDGNREWGFATPASHHIAHYDDRGIHAVALKDAK